MGLFIFDIRTLNFSILQKTTFAAQALDRQVQGKKIPIFVYVSYQSEDTYLHQLFQGYIFCFLWTLEFSTGACQTPTGK